MAVVAVDFDGTLSDADPEAVRDFFQMLRTRGYDVIIHSCRAIHSAGSRHIADWCVEAGVNTQVVAITHEKPNAVAYVDDRAIRYEGDFVDVIRKLDAFDDRGAR